MFQYVINDLLLIMEDLLHCQAEFFNGMLWCRKSCEEEEVWRKPKISLQLSLIQMVSTRVNFGSNASTSNRSQAPPPYNAVVHKMTWKGSQESLNSCKRADSPMFVQESSCNSQMGHVPLHRTVSPVTSQVTGAAAAEQPRVEWRVTRMNNAAQPWQGAHVPAPQQRFIERTGPKCNLPGNLQMPLVQNPCKVQTQISLFMSLPQAQTRQPLSLE